MTRRSRWVPALTGLALLALAGCSGDPGATSTGGKIPVVASTNVWGSVVQAVGGSRVSVRSLIDNPAADPHAYQDKPADATALIDAKLVVYNGGGYDDFFTELVRGTGSKAREVDAFSLSGQPDGANEHVWYDLATVKKVADRVAADLGAIDPRWRKQFVANAETFVTRIDALAAKARQVGAVRPRARVVATEPVAHYLLDAVGLTDATPPEFSEAIEEETDPPVAAVAETTDLINDRHVAMLVQNVQTEIPITNSLTDIAKNARIPVITVTETLPTGVKSYVEWMTDQLDAVEGALARS
jgi:zinc/manganese transport system substrate-binding protein